MFSKRMYVELTNSGVVSRQHPDLGHLHQARVAVIQLDQDMSLGQRFVRGGDGAGEKLGEGRAPQSADTSPDGKMVSSRWTDLQHLHIEHA